MAWRQPGGCLSLVIWMCFTSVVSAKNVSLENQGLVPNRPAVTVWRNASNITSPTSTLSATRLKPTLTTEGGVDNQQHTRETQSPQNNNGGKRNTGMESSGSDGMTSAIRTSASSSSSATAEQLRSATATSLAGTLVLLLISVVIAGALFVMVICFIHKWKENMGTGQYPRVVYSMLRQSEDEPEDVLGEILINIGLATPGDTRPLTPSSSSSSSRCSPTPAEPVMDLSDLEGTKFTTIPLRSDEAAKRLMVPDPEESDEELLQ